MDQSVRPYMASGAESSRTRPSSRSRREARNRDSELSSMRSNVIHLALALAPGLSHGIAGVHARSVFKLAPQLSGPTPPSVWPSPLHGPPFQSLLDESAHHGSDGNALGIRAALETIVLPLLEM